MIYARIAAYVLVASLLFGSGWTVASWRDKSTLETRIAADATDRALGEETIRKALQGQLDAAKATLASNGQTMVDLANANGKLTTERDANLALARRLLSQARPTSPGHSVSETSDQPGTLTAGGTGQNADVASLLVDTADECERNANRLDALASEIRSQL